MDDSKIIELFFERSEQAIIELSKKYGTLFISVAENVLRDKHESEECVNDAFVKAWHSIPPYSPTSLSAFLGAITRNLAINRLEASLTAKRNAKILPVLDELAEILPAAQGQEEMVHEILLRQALNSFLASLPLSTRRIFL